MTSIKHSADDTDCFPASGLLFYSLLTLCLTDIDLFIGL